MFNVFISKSDNQLFQICKSPNALIVESENGCLTVTAGSIHGSSLMGLTFVWSKYGELAVTNEMLVKYYLNDACVEDIENHVTELGLPSNVARVVVNWADQR